MWSCKISRNSQILFLRYSQTKADSLFCFLSFVLFVSLEPIANLCGVFTKLKPKHYPNRKCQKPKIIFFNFKLILLDRIHISGKLSAYLLQI